MITGALAALVLLALLLNHKQTVRHEQRIDRLLFLTGQERKATQEAQAELLEVLRRPHPDIAEFIALTERLCQRLQAPEAAVVEHQMAQPLPDLPAAVLPDDDAGWYAAQQGVTKEQLADALMEAEQDASATA